MKCSIFSVGTELLMGQVTDTNAVFLSRQLNLLGFDVLYRYTVGDNDGRLGELLELALKDTDLVVMTGGLGPTEDDMTKETVTRVLHDELVMHEPSRKALIERYKIRPHKMTPNNLKQAMMPSRAVVFDNDAGTAPGFCLEYEGKRVICMPGPPREMTRMYERRVLPYLEPFRTASIYQRTLRFFGYGESRLETALLDLIDSQTDPTIATYAKEGECTVRVASKREDGKDAKKAVDDMVDVIHDRLSDYCFSTDNEELVEVVAKKLLDRGITISCAESMTGGMFAETLTKIPGISEVFDRGIVSYTYKAKMEELGVHPETLQEFTAVSEPVAVQMAEGVQKASGSRLAVSVTGIAGPGGAEPGKPVGLVYIGCIFDGKTTVRRYVMRNVNRDWNRHYAVLLMLNMINKIIDGKDVPEII